LVKGLTAHCGQLERAHNVTVSLRHSRFRSGVRVRLWRPSVGRHHSRAFCFFLSAVYVNDRQMDGGMVATLLVTPTWPATAQTNGQLWGNVTLNWLKSEKLTLRARHRTEGARRRAKRRRTTSSTSG
jgi:hypothetical protein